MIMCFKMRGLLDFFHTLWVQLVYIAILGGFSRAPKSRIETYEDFPRFGQWKVKASCGDLRNYHFHHPWYPGIWLWHPKLKVRYPTFGFGPLEK